MNNEVILFCKSLNSLFIPILFIVVQFELLRKLISIGISLQLCTSEKLHRQQLINECLHFPGKSILVSLIYFFQIASERITDPI